MNIFRNWKVITAFVLVFAAGFVTSSVWVHFRYQQGPKKAFTVESWNSTAMNFLRQELKLTPEEEPKVRAIVEDNGRQLGQILGQAARISGTNLVASWKQVDPLLTPGQRVIYHQKCDDFRCMVKSCLDLELPPDPWSKESQ